MIKIDQNNGEVWSALGSSRLPNPNGCSVDTSSLLGHCYLMQDDLQQAYGAYQQALYLLPNPKVRFHARPTLCWLHTVLTRPSFVLPRRTRSSGTVSGYSMTDTAPWITPRKRSHPSSGWTRVRILQSPACRVLMSGAHQANLDFDKANEILFRLGIIYKQQGKYAESLDCFDRILRNPPNPLAHADIWFQIGHVYEQQRDVSRLRENSHKGQDCLSQCFSTSARAKHTSA